MRKLSWIVLLALTCACGDDKSKNPDAGSNPDGGRPGNGPGCDLEIGSYEGYTGPLVWSEAHLQACDQACPGLTPVDCLQNNCPKAAEFFTCLDEELYACQTSPGQDCRLEYEDWNCCAFENCNDEKTDQDIRACLQSNCSAANNTVEECYVSNTASPGFVRCRENAYNSCLIPISCKPEDASPIEGYVGTRTWKKAWTNAEHDACVTSCSGAPVPAVCQNTKCPGAAAYLNCMVEETAACTTQAGGECRESWENVFCCARTNCGGAGDTAQLDACLKSLCDTEYATFNTCDQDSREGSCKATAAAACAVDQGDAGVPPGDAGAPDSGAAASVPEALRRFERSAAGSTRALRSTSLPFSPWTRAAEKLRGPLPSRYTR